MKKIVIFGAGDIAELAKFYFENDTDGQVVAFTVDKEYIKETTFCELPVVGFEDVEKHYPPDDHYLFIAVSYRDMNEIREKKYFDGKKKGYKFTNYISSKATILTESIGENNFILEDNTIQPFVKIGDNNIIWSGNHIGHHSEIGNNCFITSQVTISGRVKIEDNCFLGVNATIRNNITVKYKTLIGAGAWISSDTQDYGVYVHKSTKSINKKSTDILL
ncbi:acetyltransferase [Wukongibacter baidiensis]|uniref:acetyltransferase n=1 Tax=Wukongibacter baidiensis TaxID=1723361 RepID=UPI003D7FDC96